MANSNFALSYPEIWSKYMARNLDAESVMLPLVHRSLEADVKSFGDTINVQKWGSVTVGDYTIGSDTSVEAQSLTNAQLTLDQAKYFRFVIDKLESAQSHLDLVKGFTNRGLIAMAQKIDDRLFTHYADAASGNAIGTTTAPITITKDNVYDYIVELGLILDEDNVPSDGRALVIDPGTKAMLVRNENFIHATSMGDKVLSKNEIGEVAGFKVVTSNRITTVSGSKPLMAFHPEFLSIAIRVNPDYVETYKPEAQFGVGVKGLAFYGTKVFNSAMGAVLHKAV